VAVSVVILGIVEPRIAASIAVHGIQASPPGALTSVVKGQGILLVVTIEAAIPTGVTIVITGQAETHEPAMIPIPEPEIIEVGTMMVVDVTMTMMTKIMVVVMTLMEGTVTTTMTDAPATIVTTVL
jgi:hypothetical protein